jgi:hypothetical protein
VIAFSGSNNGIKYSVQVALLLYQLYTLNPCQTPYMSASTPLPSRRVSSSHTSYQPSNLSITRNNPISLRIYKATSTTFDDPSSREALEIASSFYSSSSSEKGKSKAYTIDVDGEDDDDILSVNGNGKVRRTLIRGEAASLARKGLKRDIEARLAGGSQRFLEAFGEVDKVGQWVLRLKKTAKVEF